MGFELRREVVLTFDPPYDGLEIRCSATVPVRRVFELTRAAAEVPDDDDGSGFERVMQLWVNIVQPRWNAELDGQPVPCTAQAIVDLLPAELAFRLVPAWRDAVTGVSAPLPETSPDGGPVPSLARLSTPLPS
jgi:hypothetical protein